MANDNQIGVRAKWRLFLGVLTMIVLVGSAVWIVTQGRDDARSVKPVEIGSPVPDLEMQTLDGETIQISDFEGRPLVINFWASWCTPCRREFPLFLEVTRTHDFTLLGVVFQDSSSAAQRFADEFGADWPMLIDTNGLLSTTFGVKAPPGIPQTLFVHSDGRLIDHAFGEINREKFDNLFSRTFD